MKTKIFYFSGTGNSLWVARKIAAALEEAEIVPMVRELEAAKADNTEIVAKAEKVGLVFPVYAWGAPGIVVSFLKKLSGEGIDYCFAAVTCGGSQGGTLLQTQRLLKEQGIELQTGFAVKLPSNYIITNGAKSMEAQQKMFAKAEQRLDKMLPLIRDNQKHGVEKEFFLINALGGVVYSLFMRSPDKARYLWSDVKCNGCGICARVCPTGNITIGEKNKPVWERNCEQCLACLQWCPTKSIQYKHSTQYRRRYHHPEVTAEEIAHRGDIRGSEVAQSTDQKPDGQKSAQEGSLKRFRTLKIKRPIKPIK